MDLFNQPTKRSIKNVYKKCFTIGTSKTFPYKESTFRLNALPFIRTVKFGQKRGKLSICANFVCTFSHDSRALCYRKSFRICDVTDGKSLLNASNLGYVFKY